MGALFGLVTSLVIFGIRCSAGVNPKSSSPLCLLNPSEDSLICPEYGFLHFSILFFPPLCWSPRQCFENRNLSHEKIFCEMEQNSGFLCCLEDSEDVLEKITLRLVSTCPPVNEMWGYSIFTQTNPLNSQSLVIQIYS